jgi:hypothetical protein
MCRPVGTRVSDAADFTHSRDMQVETFAIDMHVVAIMIDSYE